MGHDRADGGSDELRRRFRHEREGGAHEMDTAALPTRPMHHRADRRLEAFVRVTDHELPPGEPVGNQATEKAQPEGAILAGTHIQPQDFPLSAHRVEPNGNDDGLRDHSSLRASFEKGGVEPEIRIRACLAQWPAAEAFDLAVQLLPQQRDLARADPPQLIPLS